MARANRELRKGERQKMNLNYEKGVGNKQANNVAYIVYRYRLE